MTRNLSASKPVQLGPLLITVDGNSEAIEVLSAEHWAVVDVEVKKYTRWLYPTKSGRLSNRAGAELPN
jgi:hypothetical protein